MDRSSRAAPPPPLDLESLYGDTGVDQTSPGSIDSPGPFQPKRATTFSSSSTNPSSIKSPGRRTSSGWVKSSPTVNVHTTCGRHTDQLLFGGPSLRGFARAFLGKNKNKKK